jgi:hypothetical protein
MVKKKHNPIKGQKLIDKVENKHNGVLIPLIPQGIYVELETKGRGKLLHEPSTYA